MVTIYQVAKEKRMKELAKKADDVSVSLRIGRAVVHLEYGNIRTNEGAKEFDVQRKHASSFVEHLEEEINKLKEVN